MIPLARNGYTVEQVQGALQGRYGARRVEFRYDLCDDQNMVVRSLSNVTDGSISHEGLADIKRTANFTLTDDGSVNYLRDRVKPWLRLHMPVVPTAGAVRPSTSYDEAVEHGVRGLLARWRFDELVGATMAEDASGNGNVLILGASAQPGQSALLEDLGRSARFSDAVGSDAEAEEAGFLNGHTAVTFAGWFKSETLGADAVLLSTTVGDSWGDLEPEWEDLAPAWEGFSGGVVGGLSVEFVGASKSISATLYVNDVAVTASTPPNTQTTERTFFAFTWVSGGNVTLYLDGEQVAEIDSTLIGDLRGIGSLTVGGLGFVGQLDDLLFSSRSVPARAIRDLYVTGAAVGPAAGPGLTYVEWPLGVFLLSSPERSVDEAGVVTRSVDAYDQTVILRSQLTSEPYYVSAGTAYTDAIIELLGATPGIPSFQVAPSSATLPAQKVWEGGTSHLEIINELCSALNYEALWFDADGTAIVAPYVAPQDRPVEYEYLANEVSVLVPGASQALDLFEQPNRWSLVVSEPDRPPLVATYTNSDPASPTSTVNRGRVVTDFRTENEAVDQATLDDKVRQLAQESAQVFEQVEFVTAIMPMHAHRDVYRLEYPALAIDGTFSEVDWAFDLRAGSEMTHTARRTIVLNGVLT